jgi:hypothetical protein
LDMRKWFQMMGLQFGLTLPADLTLVRVLKLISELNRSALPFHI